MVDITSKDQEKKAEMIDKLTNEFDDDDVSPENKLETVMLTMFAVVIMGILLFLFR